MSISCPFRSVPEMREHQVPDGNEHVTNESVGLRFGHTKRSFPIMNCVSILIRFFLFFIDEHFILNSQMVINRFAQAGYQTVENVLK